MLTTKSSSKFMYMAIAIFITIFAFSIVYYKYPDHIKNIISKINPPKANHNVDSNAKEASTEEVNAHNAADDLVSDSHKVIDDIKVSDPIHSDVEMVESKDPNQLNASNILMAIALKYQNNKNFIEELNDLQKLPLDVDAKQKLLALKEYSAKTQIDETIIFPVGRFSSIISHLIVVKKIDRSSAVKLENEDLTPYFIHLNSYFHSNKFILDCKNAQHNN